MMNAYWIAAVGFSWAGACWCVLAWDLRILMRAIVREVSLLCAALQHITRTIYAHLPSAARATQDVTLGDVSEMIDVINLGLSAGLSFDAALGLFCEYRRSSLARHMQRARLSWQLGIASREDALLHVASDAHLRVLESLAASVSQALHLGAPLTDMLMRQGQECRAAYRAEVERQIEQAPVKLIIPTASLILPALLLSIIGPLLAAGGMI